MKKTKNFFKEKFNNIKTGKKAIYLQIIGIFVLTLGFTLALEYISESINTSLTTANIGVVYVGDSTITKDLFLPIEATETSTKAAIANFTVKGAESNPTDVDIIYDVTLTNIDITEGLFDEDFKFQLYKNGTLISQGNFSNLQVEKTDYGYKKFQRAILNEEVMTLPKYTDTADSFELRIYILETGVDQSTMMGQNFSADLEIATYTTKGGATNRNKYTNLITIDITDVLLTSNIGTFSHGLYNVSTNCDNASSRWIAKNREFRISNLTGYANCEATYTALSPSDYTTLYQQIINDYNNGSNTKNIYKEDHTLSSGSTYSEYRYEGTDTAVENYVWFNNELWRIIGAFPGGTPSTMSGTSFVQGDGAPSVNNTVKIIRNDAIGSFAWDKDNTNNWSTAELNTNILNNLYLNSGSGTCDFYSTSVAKACSFSENGLLSVQDYIEDATWNLGGWGSSSATTVNMYNFERGTTICSGCSYPFLTTAKVGLMYPSDYGYATASDSCQTGTSLNSYEYESCGKDGWLLKYGYEWTQSLFRNYANRVFYVGYTAYLNYNYAYNGYSARPVVYLKSNIYVTGGDGSVNNPYQIAIG